MDKRIKKALEDEVIMEFERMKSLDPSSEEYAKIVKNLDTMYKLYAENSKEKKEEAFKWLKLGVEAAGLVLPIVVYASFLERGFKFETDGTYTSKTFMNLIGRLKPTK